MVFIAIVCLYLFPGKQKRKRHKELKVVKPKDRIDNSNPKFVLVTNTFRR